MGKKGLIGLSIIGGVCLIGILVWSYFSLSANQGKDTANSASSSELSDNTSVSAQKQDGLSQEESGLITAEPDEQNTGKEASDKTTSSEKKNTDDRDGAKDKTASASRTGSKAGASGKKHSSDGQDKKNNPGRKDKPNNKNNQNKDKNSSTADKNSNTGGDSGANHSDQSGSNTDGSQTSQDGQNQNNKSNRYQSVVDGLTITSEQAECVVSGNTVTIRQAGTYTLTGKLSNGQVIVDTEKTSKVVIVCNAMSLNCSHSSPFYVKSADDVTLQLAAGTTNSITDGAAYTFSTVNKEPDAACFSEEDLTIEGSGTLLVTGKYQDGIASKNDIKIKQGTVVVTAADDGIRGKDGIDIQGGSVKVISQSHALKTTETARTEKGLVEISGGSVHLDAVGDGIHSTNQIKVSGGNTYIDAKNEGLDSDSSFLMTGGTMVIDGPKSSNHSIFDCAKGAVVHGGTFFAVGSSAMTKPLGKSGSQNALYYKAGSEQATETTVKITNASGQTMYQHKVTRKYQCVIYSAPNLAKGSYSIYCGSARLGSCKVEGI